MPLLAKCEESVTLSGGINPVNEQRNDIIGSGLAYSSCDYNRLITRLSDKGLQAVEVGGSGDCFFRSFSHQYYGTAENHMEIRQAGVAYLQRHPELFIEIAAVNFDSWQTYLQRMATPGTWCDNLIIQAVANQFNCVIHIIESGLSCRNGTTIMPPSCNQTPRITFIGYLEGLHYVSTVSNGKSKGRLKYLKSKFTESPQHYNKRLETIQRNYHLKRKQHIICEHHTSKQTKKVSNFTKSTLSKEDYLAHFDFEAYGSLHEQPWAQKSMSTFHKENKYTTYQCKVCFEAWHLKASPKALEVYQCSRCARDKEFPKKFSKANFMIPSAVPNELMGLTQVEEMLIAHALPIMHIYVKPGGQRGYSGHCVNLPQNITELANFLPRFPKDLSIIIIKTKGSNNCSKNLTVRKKAVENALNWLLKFNPHYADVKINYEALNSLPDNNVPKDILSVEADDSVISDSLNCSQDHGPLEGTDDIVYDDNTETSSFLPVNSNRKKEDDSIREKLLSATTDWPPRGSEPLNEYTTPFLATMAFPTLFPDGQGDPTNPSICRNVSLKEKIKHLIKFGERKEENWIYRFAKHPRFSYWALNMLQRSQILQQTGIFLKQNPGEQHLTLEQLKDMITNNSSNVLLSKLSRYIANITGSDAYWYKAKEELKAIIQYAGPPTFFFTLSAADMHWPELHALLGSDVMNNDNSSEVRRQNVKNNPHIVDWFFTERVKNFIKHWLYDTLDVNWHWYRFEYQSRGSIHCHGLVKLKNDPDLCHLSEIALKSQLHLETNKENPDAVIIREGKNAADRICKYVDWLLSTCNPDPPDENVWIKPSVHPCQVRYEDIDCTMNDNDYVDLLNSVQRHTRCSTSYCLRNRMNETELKCRFNFPVENCEKTTLLFEPINTKEKKIQTDSSY